ncbi:3-succinoylsemialdehyde-pyridine dehydrogenase [compost metagenome]
MSEEEDILTAIESARLAFALFSSSTKNQRIEYLQSLHDAVMSGLDELSEVTIEEYGATLQRSQWSNRYAAETFLHFKETLISNVT